MILFYIRIKQRITEPKLALTKEIIQSAGKTYSLLYIMEDGFEICDLSTSIRNIAV